MFKLSLQPAPDSGEMTHVFAFKDVELRDKFYDACVNISAGRPWYQHAERRPLRLIFETLKAKGYDTTDPSVRDELYMDFQELISQAEALPDRGLAEEIRQQLEQLMELWASSPFVDGTIHVLEERGKSGQR